jgi:excisionase family DNA binding protein
VSLADAASYLGVSERTVLRRIRRHELRAYKIPGDRGDVWRVLVDGMTVTPAAQPGTMSDIIDAPAGVPSADPPEVLALVQLVDRLQQEAREATIRATWLEGQLQQAQERIKLLEAPKDEPAAQPEPAQRAPWWRRLFS